LQRCDTFPEFYFDLLFTNIGRLWYNEYEVDMVGFDVDGT